MIDRPHPPAPRGGDALAAYRAEVLRWNSQINLVSRQDPPGRLDGLMDQCDRAFAALATADPGAVRGAVLYCDLGSGGGLPGFIWHERLVRTARRVESWLVEPREKRAWFLERVARLGGPPAYGVLCGRWGEVSAAAGAPAETALVSLKALRLTDPEVLEGLAALRQGSASLPERVVIVRFHPPRTAWGAELGEALQWAGPGGVRGLWRGESAMALPVGASAGPPATLAVCTYVRTSG